MTQAPVPPLRALLLATSCIAGAGMARAEVYCDNTFLPVPAACPQAAAGVTADLASPGPSTERAAGAPGAGFDATGFSISIDNEPVAGAPPPPVPQRQADLGFDLADVDVRFDGLETRPILNVATTDLRSTARAGETVSFRSSANYPAYIDRAEIVVRDRAGRGRIVARIPASANGIANWPMTSEGSGDFDYVLRVYDTDGRFDETEPLPLRRTERAFEPDALSAPPIAAGEGEDRTAIRRIPVSGGTVTVAGTNASPSGHVLVMGERVPVDADGRFVVSRILPSGDRIVAVETGGRRIVRDVLIPERDFFYTGIVDVTAGRDRDGALGETDDYVDGRIAYYFKGRFANGWRVTSSLDTNEGPIEDIFRRIDDKSPREVIDRLREDGDVYPTYGDDSVFFDDTPSRGNVYARIENDTTRLTFGNFQAGLDQGGLLSNTRDLYGAEVRHVARDTTSRGDARYALQLYAASPDSAAQRDILRGTGGSVYFLSRQDLTYGTVNLSVRTTDADTGRVVASRELVEGIDYDVDHLQGVVTLTSPVLSSASDGGLIREAPGDYDVDLVAQYEYAPTNGTDDMTAYGGRVEGWIGDRLRLGATAMRESTETDEDQNVTSADLRFVLGETSHVSVEAARTEGPGFSRTFSTDGGLTIFDAGGDAAGTADAVSVEALVDLADLGFERDGTFEAYYLAKEEGFSTVTEDVTADERLVGLAGDVALSDRTRLAFEIEDYRQDDGDEKSSLEASLAYAISPYWTVEVGLARTDQVRVGDPEQTGERTDAGVELTYAPSEDLAISVFGQKTIGTSGTIGDNDRIGVGLDAHLTERLRFAVEVSDGDRGHAGAGRLTYAPAPDREVYLGYELEPEIADFDDDALAEESALIYGTRYRMTDRVSTYFEDRMDLPGAENRSLTRAYGVRYTPTDLWTLSGAVESGRVRDEFQGDFDRTAVSLGAAYARGDEVAGQFRLEYRVEDGEGLAQDRETIAVLGTYSNRVARDWRLLLDLDALVSESDESAFRDGEYVRASIGAAYRPIETERLNALFRYTYYRDLPGENQVLADGIDEGPEQISHVVSANLLYDLNRQFTLGAKLGYRTSEIAPRGTQDFVENTAILTALRLDYHVISSWDAMIEGRVLHTPETDTRETGALVGLYRHLGERAKIGIGYEWGDVSDDLTDIAYDGGGPFVNLVAKF